MARRTRDEIMQRLQVFAGDDVSDEMLDFIADVSDSIGDDSATERIAELEKQIADQDRAWREKYKSAFFSGQPVPADDESDDTDSDNEPKTFEELFS